VDGVQLGYDSDGLRVNGFWHKDVESAFANVLSVIAKTDQERIRDLARFIPGDVFPGHIEVDAHGMRLMIGCQSGQYTLHCGAVTAGQAIGFAQAFLTSPLALVLHKEKQRLRPVAYWSNNELISTLRKALS